MIYYHLNSHWQLIIKNSVINKYIDHTKNI